MSAAAPAALSACLVFMPVDGLAGPAPILPALGVQVEGKLEAARNFWIHLYSKVPNHEVLIHDTKHLGIVYEVLSLRKIPPRKRGHAMASAKRKWRAVLMRLHDREVAAARSPATEAALSRDEMHVVQQFAKVLEPSKYLIATHRRRIRAQVGQRDSFLAAYYESGRYLPQMEEVFRKHGLPPELARLPFVESSFNTRAMSKVGASGIWQFMPSTARLYIRVDEAVDERNDPIRACEAAARLLKDNYESLGNWPLAVTAYNHGRKSLMRAIQRIGSSQLEDLFASYRARGFGFASSNFFAQLLAAVELERNAEAYFGGRLPRAPEISRRERVLERATSARELKREWGGKYAEIRRLNLAITDRAWRGHVAIPAGTVLRLPECAKGVPCS